MNNKGVKDPCDGRWREEKEKEESRGRKRNGGREVR